MGKITLEEYIELFRKKAEQMGEFPDKVIINALTGTATRHRADKAQAITTVLQNMLMDPNHPAKHKLPICYLVDSIVKNISDPYADLFEIGLTPWFCRAYDAVDDKSKRHLARVLATWEVQSIFSADKRKEIQRHILNSQPNASSSSSSSSSSITTTAASSPMATSTSVASAPATAVTTVHPPLPGAPPLLVPPPPAVSTAVPYPPPPVAQAPVAAPAVAAPLPPPPLPPVPAVAAPVAPPDIQAMINSRMKQLLDQQLLELGESSTMSLDDLWRTNAELASGFRLVAQAQVHEQLGLPPPPPPPTIAMGPVQQPQAPIAHQAPPPLPAVANQPPPPQQQLQQQAPRSQPQLSVQLPLGTPPPWAAKPPPSQDFGRAVQVANDVAAGARMALDASMRGDVSGAQVQAAEAAGKSATLACLLGGDAAAAVGGSGNGAGVGVYLADLDPLDVRALARGNPAGVRRLYGEGFPFWCKQDGTRFATQVQLDAHMDLLFRRKRARREQKGAASREWYCTAEEWMTDFGRLAPPVGSGAGDGDGDGGASLLYHWVAELDEFKEGEIAFMDKMRAVVNDFVDNWGEEMLGPLAEHLLSSPPLGQDGGVEGQGQGQEGRDYGEGKEGLSDLWPRLSRIHEGMEDLEASRTKVELARQLAVDRSNPESISHVLDKIRDLLIDAEDENVGLSQGLLEETHEDLNSLEDCVKRAGEKLERSVESLPVLPITLEEVEERTVKWRELSRKHGIPPERLGSMQAQLRVELDQLAVAAEALPLAREKEEQWRVAAEQVAGELSAVRRRVAAELEDLVNPMMPDVGLEGATLKVLVEESKTLGPAGADRIQFLLEANQGQTRGTVDAVASSGEKSRLLLLFETRLPPPQAQSGAELAGQAGVSGGEEPAAAGVEEGGEDTVSALTGGAGAGAGGTDGGGAAAAVRAAPCAVLYDEIDAHVGGRTAVAVGRLLANQGRDSQVVVVTHTASVAALADQHLVVDKATADSRASGASAGTNGSSGDGVVCATVDAAAPPLAATAAGVDEGKVSPSAWRSRRHGASDGGLTVSIREVRGREREDEVARMAAGDMGGGAAAELAREMLRYSRRQG